MNGSDGNEWKCVKWALDSIEWREEGVKEEGRKIQLHPFWSHTHPSLTNIVCVYECNSFLPFVQSNSFLIYYPSKQTDVWNEPLPPTLKHTTHTTPTITASSSSPSFLILILSVLSTPSAKLSSLSKSLVGSFRHTLTSYGTRYTSSFIPDTSRDQLTDHSLTEGRRWSFLLLFFTNNEHLVHFFTGEEVEKDGTWLISRF